MSEGDKICMSRLPTARVDNRRPSPPCATRSKTRPSSTLQGTGSHFFHVIFHLQREGRGAKEVCGNCYYVKSQRWGKMDDFTRTGHDEGERSTQNIERMWTDHVDGFGPEDNVKTGEL